MIAATRTLVRSRTALARLQRPLVQQTRNMGAGGGWMHAPEQLRQIGEGFSVICWLWIIHRARHDLDVVFGYRHPFEHAHDPFAPAHDDHHHEEEE
mmetsp:Transcript_5584/g.8576  ORF Transcript_5584/g.8576 Transcript_5584/m.8576 type:complete len:96 (-) Transcript_5584:132-419(-)